MTTTLYLQIDDYCATRVRDIDEPLRRFLLPHHIDQRDDLAINKRLTVEIPDALNPCIQRDDRSDWKEAIFFPEDFEGTDLRSKIRPLLDYRSDLHVEDAKMVLLTPPDAPRGYEVLNFTQWIYLYHGEPCVVLPGEWEGNRIFPLRVIEEVDA